MKKYPIFLFLIFQFVVMQAQERNPWSVYMTPAVEHERLATYEGKFQVEITMSGAKEPIVVYAVHQMILDGRFLDIEQTGKMMDMDYVSYTTLGYNTIDHTYTMVTYTNMGTGILTLTGKWDNEVNGIVLYGNLTNPVSERTIRVKQVIHFLDDDSFLIESFDKEEDAPESKTVVYKFKRV